MGRYLLGATPHDYNGDDMANPYRMDLSATEYVTRLYQTFLRRAPDSNFNGYVTTAATAAGRNTVLEEFLSMSAYTERSGALYREINWLIGDHLGTPRLIAERTGKLEGVKRSDYLPFGESANTLNPQSVNNPGGRGGNNGYVAENVRQGFTGYEEDSETGLDYAQARYFASGQGRFVSVDPLMASANPGNPQSFNRYAYALNNPVRFTDPTGLITESQYDGTDEKEKMLREGFRKQQEQQDAAERYAENEERSRQFWEEEGMEPLGAGLAESTVSSPAQENKRISRPYAE